MLKVPKVPSATAKTFPSTLFLISTVKNCHSSNNPMFALHALEYDSGYESDHVSTSNPNISLPRLRVLESRDWPRHYPTNGLSFFINKWREPRLVITTFNTETAETCM